MPVIYTEIISQSRRLLSEALNVAHKLVRMRARPKILLCSNYEEAEREVLKYREYLLGVISDVEFPRGGGLTPEAGFELARMVRETVPDVPIVLQSSRTEFMEGAHREGFGFLQKRSPTLLGDLRSILTEEMGFGDFVFHHPDGSEVGRASDLNALETLLHTVPEESLAYHGQRNHFSHWLMARTEFALAQRLRPRNVADFGSSSEPSPRLDRIDCGVSPRAEPGSHRRVQSRQLSTFGDVLPANWRRLARAAKHAGWPSFATSCVCVGSPVRFPGIRITVPPTLVLTTEIFDRFLTENELLDFAIHSDDDAEIARRFLQASFPISLLDNLLAFLEAVRYPLAVRSSSLLEDSQYQPFSGVYETFMLANCHADIQLRLEQLLEAIKLVYASTFSQHAKAYVRATPYRLEEEKMAVVVQQVVGAAHSDRFYPDFSGVVRSRNFYPMGNITVADGFAAVALGLGRAVVSGGKCLSFSPRHPQHLVQFSSVEDVLANSQTDFWALELDSGGETADPSNRLREVSFSLKAAESDGTLQMLASTYSADNHAVYDGLSRPGTRVVSFAPILKHGRFPLPQILDRLMTMGEEAMGRPVEIEFAVRLPQTEGHPADFGFLQLRPLVLSREGEDIRLDDVDPQKLVCQSSMVLGHGRLQDVRDVIVVDCASLRAPAQPRSSAERCPLQCSAERSEQAILADWRWPVGLH